KTGVVTKGFREMGFLSGAFINMLAVLGWNDGTEQEIFNIEELVSKFSVDRIGKAGAKFDFEKAKWFNHEWIKRADDAEILPHINALLKEQGVSDYSITYVTTVLSLIKERLILIKDFWEQAFFFFMQPTAFDVDAVKPKWNENKTTFFKNIMKEFLEVSEWKASVIEPFFKGKIAESGMKIGELMMPFRIMLVGGKFGRDVFKIPKFYVKVRCGYQKKRLWRNFRN